MKKGERRGERHGGDLVCTMQCRRVRGVPPLVHLLLHAAACSCAALVAAWAA